MGRPDDDAISRSVRQLIDEAGDELRDRNLASRRRWQLAFGLLMTVVTVGACAFWSAFQRSAKPMVDRMQSWSKTGARTNAHFSGCSRSYQASPCTSALATSMARSISDSGRRYSPSGVVNSNHWTSVSSARIRATASGCFGR